MKYNLIENGVIHTEDLTLSEAEEAKERHLRFFPNESWEIIPVENSKHFEKGMGLMDRQKHAYRYR